MLFDMNLMTVEIVLLKSITTALGGSIRVLDEEHLAATGQESFIKITVPMAVARAFIKRNKTGKFFQPVKLAVTSYDGVVVGLEIFPYVLGDSVDKYIPKRDGEWYSNSQRNIDNILDQAVITNLHNGDWHIDGKYVYWLPTDLDTADSIMLSSDGQFRAITVDGYPLQNIGNMGEFVKYTRHVLLFKASTGEMVVTPPIWKSLDGIGAKQLSRINLEEELEPGIAASPIAQHPFDRIDQHLSVNLNFALNAAKHMGQLFGHNVIAALQLPQLMIRLRTVNLPQVPNEVKSTFNIGMPFTHALAWLIGLSRRIETIEDQLKMRAALKYLTTKGIFHDSIFSHDHIYVKGAAETTLTVKDPDTALADSKTVVVPSSYFTSTIARQHRQIINTEVDDD